MELHKRVGFGLGHVLNDLCASMWFTYLLLFFHRVLGFDNVLSGVILAIGQVSDGLSTLFVGYFSDSTSRGNDFALCVKYGRRKAWHLTGTVCVLVSFPLIFLPCVGCSESHYWAQLVYYAAFVAIFQFGWAATQVSHLAMIPDLAHNEHERTSLTALRYGATVLSNLSVFVLAWLSLGWSHSNSGGGDDLVGPDDAPAFARVMLCCVVGGAVASALFHLLVTNESDTNDDANVVSSSLDAWSWFSSLSFYLIALVYLSTRLFVNLSQVYIPLYLQVTLRLHAVYVATIPLVMYVSGLLASVILTNIGDFGRARTMAAGALLAMAGCFWVKIGCVMDSDYRHIEIFAVAALLGSGGSVLLISSLASVADLIGTRTHSSAFVYGFMSLTDKFANGLAVVVIQQAIPSNMDSCVDCRKFYRDVLFGVCGAAAAVAAVGMAIRENFGEDVDQQLEEEDREESERTPLL